MKTPARPASPAARQTSPAARPTQPTARPAQAAARPAPAGSAPRDHKKLVIIGAIVAVALAVVGYGMSRPSTPWVFDSPEAKKSYVH